MVYNRLFLIATLLCFLLDFGNETRAVNWNSNCKCGKKNPGRIVGGVAAAVNEWPWQVALMYGQQQFCGGSLICDRYVLTAAHCLEGLKASELTVRLGDHRLSSSTETSHITISAASLISHENYNPGPETNDIALIKLTTPVKVTTNVLPVCLPSGTATYASKSATVTGWGTTSSGGSSSDVLREVTVPVLSNAACQNTGYGVSAIKDTMLCAGKAGSDSCQGDSGGPLTFLDSGGNYDQIGVVSFGNGCAEANYPGVYTRVTKYVSWIKSNTADCIFCTGMVL